MTSGINKQNAASGKENSAFDAPSSESGPSLSPGSCRPDISFFCPAYLDEDNLALVVERGVKTLQRVAGEFEWIIIDDASPDGTGAAADALAARLPQVRAVHNTQNEGHGRALKKGFSLGKFEWTGFCDGDDQYDARDIALLAAQTCNADIVITRRRNYPNGAFRGLLSATFNAALRALFGAPFVDLGSSMKLFRRDCLPHIAAKSSGIFAQCEMALRAHRAGFKIVEVEIPAYPRIGGKSSSISSSSILQLSRDALALWKEFSL